MEQTASNTTPNAVLDVTTMGNPSASAYVGAKKTASSEVNLSNAVNDSSANVPIQDGSALTGAGELTTQTSGQLSNVEPSDVAKTSSQSSGTPDIATISSDGSTPQESINSASGAIASSIVVKSEFVGDKPKDDPNAAGTDSSERVPTTVVPKPVEGSTMERSQTETSTAIVPVANASSDAVSNASNLALEAPPIAGVPVYALIPKLHSIATLKDDTAPLVPSATPQPQNIEILSVDVGRIPVWKTAWEQATAIVNTFRQYPRGSTILGPIHVVPDSPAFAHVCPEALFERVIPSRSWHRTDFRDRRRRFINSILHLLWACAYGTSCALPEPGDARHPLETQALTLERGCYYGADSLVSYEDGDTLVARILVLEALRRRSIAIQKEKKMQEAAAASATSSQTNQVTPSTITATPINSDATKGNTANVAELIYSALQAGMSGSQNSSTNASTGNAASTAVVRKPQPSEVVLVPHSKTVSGLEITKAQTERVVRTELSEQAIDRLKLLHHSAECKVRDKSCGWPECQEYQNLWPHLRICEDPNCTVSHCSSSRHCLEHQRTCNNAECAICTRVGSRVPVSVLMQGMHDAGTKRKLEDGAESLVKRSRFEGNIDVYSFVSAYFPSLKFEKWQSLGAVERQAYVFRAMSARESAREKGESRDSQSKTAKRGRVDGNCSLIATFTQEQINQHLTSLRDDFNAGISPETIRQQVNTLLDVLMTQEYSYIFDKPVDPVRDQAPDYFEIIRQPMDLGTIKRRLDAGGYRTFSAFCKDVRLVWDNARMYNPKDSGIYMIADRMSDFFEKEWIRYEQNWHNYFQGICNEKDHCSLCGGSSFLFEAPSIYCNSCTVRIKKGQPYYASKGNRYHWCVGCYNKLAKEGPDISIDNTFIPVADLKRTKNDALDSEPFVQCDHCDRWQHQICALYNGKRNMGSNIPHYCPHCILGHLKARQQTTPIAKPVNRARDLQSSPLSEFTQAKLDQFLNGKLKVWASGYTKPHKEPVPELTVKMLSNAERVLLVGPEFYNRYKPLNFPSQVLFRTKALTLWQNLGGCDVLLYALYMQEFGDDAGYPNARTAYLSYLDSVKYLEPPLLRTEVYHEILIAYLENLKSRGYNQVNLWSCPPQKGDDYIIHAHPEDQKTPRADMLRDWYLALLEEAQRRGIVEKVTFLADDYFPSAIGNEGGIDRPVYSLPYFEGDYFVSQAEVEIKKLREEGKLSPVGAPPLPGSIGASVQAAGPDGEDSDSDSFPISRGLPANRNSKKTKEKSKKSTRMKSTSRSTVARARKAVPYGLDGNPLPNDELRWAMAERLCSMRTDFIVVKLRPSCQACKKYITGDVAQGMDVKFHCKTCEMTPAPPLVPKKSGSRASKDPKNANKLTVGYNFDLCRACFEVEKKAAEAGMKSPFRLKHDHPITDLVPIHIGLPPSLEHLPGPIDERGNPLHPGDNRKDPDPIVESPFFRSRQAFLNLCQGNHYQFDLIRRAKHSSMMVLYHITHPLAPSFIIHCNHCAEVISDGFRYSCPACDEFDLCDKCYKDSEEGRIGRHEHSLNKYPVSGMLDEVQLRHIKTQEQNRKAAIAQHLSILVHAAACPGCQNPACLKMKDLYKHIESCSVTAGRDARTPGHAKLDCEVCSKMKGLIIIHSRTCKAQGEACPVPLCHREKERMRNSNVGSSSMDSRRRQKANAIMEGVEPSPEAEGDATATPQPGYTPTPMPSLTPGVPGMQPTAPSQPPVPATASMPIAAVDAATVAASAPITAVTSVAPLTMSSTGAATTAAPSAVPTAAPAATAAGATGTSGTMSNVDILLNEAPRIEAMVMELSANPEANAAYKYWLSIAIKKYEDDLRVKKNIPASQPPPQLDRIHYLMCMKYSLHMARKHMEDLKAGRTQSLLKDPSSVAVVPKNPVVTPGSSHSSGATPPPPPVEPTMGTDLTV